MGVRRARPNFQELSRGEIQDYFEKQLIKAVKVIELKNKLNTSAKVVGERAQILMRLDPQKTLPTVLRTVYRFTRFNPRLNNVHALEKSVQILSTWRNGIN